MKRFALLLCTILFAVGLFAQTTGDQINALQQQIDARVAKRADFKAASDAQDAKASDIKFVYEAWQKQSAKYDQDLAAYNAKYTEVARGYQLLEPAAENYKQRVSQHNANQCTEKCVNGSCDGSCAWYNSEKAQLDANKAQLEQAYAPLEARASQLQNDKGYLDQTADKLNTIQQGVRTSVATWKEAEERLKSAFLDNEAEITRLQDMIARLRGSYNNCILNIPKECDKPNATLPNGDPLLNGKCEEMHAACGRMFDGNK